MRTHTLKKWIAACLLPLLAGATQAEEQNHNVEGFHIEFLASYLGFKADIVMTLEPAEQPDEYLYKVSTTARGLAKLVRSGTGVETALFRSGANGIESLLYTLDDGTKEVENDTRIEFDYAAGVAHSNYKGAPLDLELTTGLVDRLTADIIAIERLRAGQKAGGSDVVIRNSVRRYEYTRLGEETVSVPAGKFATVIYMRQRPGSTRAAKVWYAPELGYLPVKIDQLKRGDSQVVAEAIKIKR